MLTTTTSAAPKPEQGKQMRLLRTQTEAGGNGACTVCAVMFADAVLHYEITLQPALLDRLLDAGCATWLQLTCPERKAALALPSEYLTVHDVVRGVIDVATGRPRWRIKKELYGLHISGSVPPAVLEELRQARVTNNDGNAIPMAYCEDLRMALRCIDDTMDEVGETATQAAAVLTWNNGAHSVCIGAHAYGSNGEYYVIDSLNGTFVKFDAPRYFIDHVAWNVCPAQTWSSAEQRSAGAAVPGQFFISILTLAK